jgi:hypothetical protein
VDLGGGRLDDGTDGKSRERIGWDVVDKYQGLGMENSRTTGTRMLQARRRALVKAALPIRRSLAPASSLRCRA